MFVLFLLSRDYSRARDNVNDVNKGVFSSSLKNSLWYQVIFHSQAKLRKTKRFPWGKSGAAFAYMEQFIKLNSSEPSTSRSYRGNRTDQFWMLYLNLENSSNITQKPSMNKINPRRLGIKWFCFPNSDIWMTLTKSAMIHQSTQTHYLQLTWKHYGKSSVGT